MCLTKLHCQEFHFCVQCDIRETFDRVNDTIDLTKRFARILFSLSLSTVS